MAAKEPTVLIVEDETGINEAYQIVLQKAGYRILAAYDGEEALEITKLEEPDLILLDLRMPNMNGLEFLKRYNLLEDHPDVKVVVFSNYDMKKEIDEAYALGAAKYVLKAWASPKDLEKIVKNTLQEKEKVT